MSTLKKIVIAMLVLVVLIPASAFGYMYFKLNTMYDKNADTNLLNKTDYKQENGITNILLVGTDGRTSDETGTRSDSMMILTLDTKHKDLKLTSLARDSYVEIPGRGNEKLTHAYAYGGINLLVETIENNFKIDIQDYVVVDFFSFMDIVDALGGIVIDVKSSELKELSKYTTWCHELNTNPNKGELELIKSTGIQKLNGYQTLAYARIRYNDSAFERDKRQRDIIQALTNSLKELPITQYPKLVNTILPYVKTTLKPTSIISIATKVLGFGTLELKQLEFPIDDGINSKGGIIDGKGWVLQFNPDSLTTLHDFIFEDVE